jgi:hypothetical protein
MVGEVVQNLRAGFAGAQEQSLQADELLRGLHDHAVLDHDAVLRRGRSL